MRFLAIVLIFVGLHANAAWIAGTNGVVCSASNESVIKGGISPWPWGREMVFPWSDIDGVWQASTGGCSSLFTFKVVNQVGTNTRLVSISQYDPKQCREIARGVGTETNKVVHAVLTGLNGSFELTIHAFKQENLKSNFPMQRPTYSNGRRMQVPSPQDSVIVMRMRKMGPGSTIKANFQMERLKRTPVMLCE